MSFKGRALSQITWACMYSWSTSVCVYFAFQYCNHFCNELSKIHQWRNVQLHSIQFNSPMTSWASRPGRLLLLRYCPFSSSVKMALSTGNWIFLGPGQGHEQKHATLNFWKSFAVHVDYVDLLLLRSYGRSESSSGRWGVPNVPCTGAGRAGPGGGTVHGVGSRILVNRTVKSSLDLEIVIFFASCRLVFTPSTSASSSPSLYQLAVGKKFPLVGTQKTAINNLSLQKVVAWWKKSPRCITSDEKAPCSVVLWRITSLFAPAVDSNFEPKWASAGLSFADEQERFARVSKVAPVIIVIRSLLLMIKCKSLGAALEQSCTIPICESLFYDVNVHEGVLSVNCMVFPLPSLPFSFLICLFASKISLLQLVQHRASFSLEHAHVRLACEMQQWQTE